MNQKRKKLIATTLTQFKETIKITSQVFEQQLISQEAFTEYTSTIIPLVDDIYCVLQEAHGEEEEAFENMPESFQFSQRGLISQDAIIDLSEAIDACNDINDMVKDFKQESKELKGHALLDEIQALTSEIKKAIHDAHASVQSVLENK